MSGELWVNLGPGMHLTPPPWIDVEAIQRDNHPRAEIVLGDETLTEAVRAKYGDTPVTKIAAIHMLEHVDQRDLVATVREWFALLAPGGQVGICQPDVRIALRYYKDGLIPERDLHRHMEVGDVWETERWETWYRDGELDSWALHSWNSVPERVHGLLRSAGFAVEEREPTKAGMLGWPLSGFGGAQLACVGTKPS